MSTEHCIITDVKNSRFKLGFETSVSGCKFILTEEGTEVVHKFWFDKATWEKLKEAVDIYANEFAWDSDKKKTTKEKLPEYLVWLPDGKNLQIGEMLTEFAPRILMETSPQYPEQAPPVAKEMVRRYNLFEVYMFYAGYCNNKIQLGLIPKNFDAFCKLPILAERLKTTKELEEYNNRFIKQREGNGQ